MAEQATGWLVGVDAGGTNVRAAALDLGSGEIRTRSGEGANWTVHGPELCRERIGKAVSEALPGGVRPLAVCLCIAGYYPPDHSDQARSSVEALWPGVPARVEPDVLGAWAGALGGEPGIVVISGTGSMAYGRNRSGEDARAGGWGPLFSDQGSGYVLALKALRTLADYVDGIQSEPSLGHLSERLLARWPELGIDLRTWLRGVYRQNWGREQIALLAGEVAAEAEAGYAGGQALIRGAATELAEMTRAVARRLGSEFLPVALQGGLGSTGIMQQELGAQLQAGIPPLRLVGSRFSPLEGALLLAAELAGGVEQRRAVLVTLSKAPRAPRRPR